MSFAYLQTKQGSSRASPSHSSKLRPRHTQALDVPPCSMNYIQECRMIADNITLYQKKIINLENLTLKLGTLHDTTNIRNNLYREIDSGNGIAKDIAEALQNFSSDFINVDYLSTEEENERKFQLSKLCKDFEVRVRSFEECVKEAIYKEKTSIINAKKNVPISESKSFYNNDDEDNEILGLLSETQLLNDTVFNEAVIAEREGEINRIQSSVIEVNTIFKDLAVIITDQGTTLDSIEVNIRDSADKTKDGLSELKKASALQQTEKIRFYLITILVLVVILAFSLWMAGFL